MLLLRPSEYLKYQGGPVGLAKSICFIFSPRTFTYLYVYMYVCARPPTATCLWRSEDNLQESVPSFYCVAPRGSTQVLSKYLSSLNHFISLALKQFFFSCSLSQSWVQSCVLCSVFNDLVFQLHFFYPRMTPAILRFPPHYNQAWPGGCLGFCAWSVEYIGQ